MALVIEGVVGEVYVTKGGQWCRVIVQAAGRVNDLVMVRKDTIDELGIAAGKAIELPVRAQVDTNAEGKPTRNIVFFHADRGPAAA